jgi:hypothetical protein
MSTDKKTHWWSRLNSFIWSKWWAFVLMMVIIWSLFMVIIFGIIGVDDTPPRPAYEVIVVDGIKCVVHHGFWSDSFSCVNGS